MMGFDPADELALGAHRITAVHMREGAGRRLLPFGAGELRLTLSGSSKRYATWNSKGRSRGALEREQSGLSANRLKAREYLAKRMRGNIKKGVRNNVRIVDKTQMIDCALEMLKI
jgi:hypothetical protein